MRNIAEKVGIRVASIYYFFESKEDLLDTIFSEFESDFAKYRTTPADIFKAVKTKSLSEVLSMMFYTFGNSTEQSRMMAISRVILSLQYENEYARKLYEKIVIQDAMDYGIEILKGLYSLSVIKEIDFKWTAFIFHSFAIALFEENLRHLKPYAQSNEEYHEGTWFICSKLANIIQQ